MLTPYYRGTLKAIQIALSDMWNDVKVAKRDADGNFVEWVPVPLTDQIAEKFHLDRIENNYFDSNGNQHGKKYYLKVPRMNLLFNGAVPSSERSAASNQWRYFNITEQNLAASISSYQPTPWDIAFTLTILSDSMDYLAQILEGHVFPYFNPSLTLRIKEIPGYNIERDLIVTLDGVSPEFSETLGDGESRVCNATLNLTVRAWFYRPEVVSKTIYQINSSYNFSNANTSAVGAVQYHTSGFATSAGNLLTSAIPTEYTTSGQYIGVNKEYDWFSVKEEL